MTVAAFASGTKTATGGGTEDFLTSVNEAGVYTLHLDLNALAAGDFLIVRVYQMVLTSGTARVAYMETFQGAQPADGLIPIGVPISNELTDAQALRFSITQTLGTGRAIPWKVLKHS